MSGRHFSLLVSPPPKKERTKQEKEQKIKNEDEKVSAHYGWRVAASLRRHAPIFHSTDLHFFPGSDMDLCLT